MILPCWADNTTVLRDVHLQKNPTTCCGHSDHKGSDWSASFVHHVRYDGCAVPPTHYSMYTPPLWKHHLPILDQHLQIKAIVVRWLPAPTNPHRQHSGLDFIWQSFMCNFFTSDIEKLIKDHLQKMLWGIWRIWFVISLLSEIKESTESD